MRLEAARGGPAPLPWPSAAARRWLACLALIGLGLSVPLLLVWSVQFPPQVDAPNHLARHYLESLHLRGEPLPPGYEIAYRVLPNLAADMLLPPLMWVLEPLAAWKVFLSFSLVLYWFGPALFILEQGEYRPPAWLAALLWLPFVLSSQFFWGFLNYYAGVGLAFLAAAHLARLDRQGRVGAAWLAVHAAFAVLLYLSHLAAVFFYAVLAGCMALARLWTLRRAGSGWAEGLGRAALLCLPLLPAVAVHLAHSAEAAGTPTLGVADLGRKAIAAAVLFRGYRMPADAAVAVLWAAAALAFFWRAPLRPRWGTAALATGALLLLYVVMPVEVNTSHGADARLLPALLVCGLAWLGTLPAARWSWIGAALLVAAIGVRGGDVWHAWQRLDRQLQDAARSFALLEPEARVLPVILTPGTTKENPEEHFASLAAISRHAYIPTLFAVWEQQPLRLTGETRLANPFKRYTAGAVENGVFTLASEADAARYDYLWIFNPEGAELRLPAAWQRTFSGERVSLWRLRPDGGAPMAGPAGRP
jgi:GNAT superfamily N-acetyltransferase